MVKCVIRLCEIRVCDEVCVIRAIRVSEIRESEDSVCYKSF